MNTSFIMLLALVIFLGAGFGGSFVGGVIYGQTLQDDESELSPRLGAAGQFPGGGQETANGGQRGQGRPEQGGGFGAAQGAGGQAASRRGGGEGNSEGGAGRPGQVGGLEASESPGGSAADLQDEGQDSALEQQASEQQSDGQNNQDGQQRERLERGGQRESTTRIHSPLQHPMPKNRPPRELPTSRPDREIAPIRFRRAVVAQQAQSRDLREMRSWLHRPGVS